MGTQLYSNPLYIFVHKVLVWGLVWVLGAGYSSQNTLSSNAVFAFSSSVTQASDFPE